MDAVIDETEALQRFFEGKTVHWPVGWPFKSKVQNGVACQITISSVSDGSDGNTMVGYSYLHHCRTHVFSR